MRKTVLAAGALVAGVAAVRFAQHRRIAADTEQQRLDQEMTAPTQPQAAPQPRPSSGEPL